MAANGAQYGVATVNYYWIGAIPAMVFLGLVMMPFYYGSKVRSVPEYLKLRFNNSSHIFNSVTFAIATILIAGVNLYALALVLELMLGWPIIVGIVVAAFIVAAYISLGGLSSAIYNEVLQFFVIIAALIPLTVVGLVDVGGWDGLQDRIRESAIGEAGLHALEGTSPGNVTNPIGASWIGLVFGLGFVLAFGYQLRRGPAGAFGARPFFRPANAADRRVPQAAAAVRDDPAGHDRARRDPRARQRSAEHGLQQRDPAADRQVRRTACWGSR
jgi:solute:Na+ symporter, SSS family